MKKIVLGALLLGGCHSIPFFKGSAPDKGRTEAASVPPRASASVRPTVQDPVPADFKYIPAAKSATPREDLFRLIDATSEAYEVLGFEKPYPLIRIVGKNNPNLGSRNAMATALINEDGKEIVYFNREWVTSGRSLKGVVVHEYAHFQTWRRYGHAVRPHGREFWSVCTKATASRNCTAYEGRSRWASADRS